MVHFVVEETRVYVKPVEGLDYDYVNANHIDVSSEQNAQT